MPKAPFFSSMIGEVRKQNPLVHQITNYVTANDCANITLAIGASPMMADAKEEVADIADGAAAVVLNLGTLNRPTVEAMVLAGQSANRAGIPVILDPVGVGASPFRNEAAGRILQKVRIDVLRGNFSEIQFFHGQEGKARGVDASPDDCRVKEEEKAFTASALSKKWGMVVAITGPTDVVSDGNRTLFIQNGHPFLSKVTGTGCMCSALAGAFCAAHPNVLLKATAAAVAAMGIAGELAFLAAGNRGSGSFRTAVLDVVSRMDDALLEERGNIREG